MRYPRYHGPEAKERSDPDEIACHWCFLDDWDSCPYWIIMENSRKLKEKRRYERED